MWKIIWQKDDSEQQIEHTRLKHQKPRTNISPYLGITNYKTCVWIFHCFVRKKGFFLEISSWVDPVLINVRPPFNLWCFACNSVPNLSLLGNLWKNPFYFILFLSGESHAIHVDHAPHTSRMCSASVILRPARDFKFWPYRELATGSGNHMTLLHHRNI